MSDATSTPTLPPLMDRISFLTHRLNALMARACNPYFQVWGVDLIMSRMMVVMLEHGPLPAGEIVRIMALPQSTISHQIKRLEKLGYVEREQGKQDSRVRAASLTEKGREVALQANLLSRQVIAVLLDSIGEEDMETVRAALKRADRALQEFKFEED
ncbi:MarR family transcriptional regulator [uncultured Erythrobacter sp.]|uniref:MarR family winged helix-turn-helix transcriptional regulator n=1 Tax=uncultured Erythrobacter sp. TaxID=263913 RepID=UPI00261A61B2|nr:MarR family transcriptional regulator [uncultured Erythrobacter sp.]